MDKKACKFCKKEIPANKKDNEFCNSSCAASFNNRGKRRNWSLGTRKIRPCLYCGEPTKNNKYCSTECSNIARRVRRWTKIQTEQRLFDIQNDKTLLMMHHDGACEICKTKEWLSSPILLILDHIDGNSDNNFLSNLRLICSNCDATLPTYKSRNKGNGRDSKRRQYRQERYNNGSCN